MLEQARNAVAYRARLVEMDARCPSEDIRIFRDKKMMAGSALSHRTTSSYGPDSPTDRLYERTDSHHMLKSDPPTVQEWLRGWALTYIPNDDEAERLACDLHDYLETNGFENLRLSSEVRQEVENMMGTAQDEDARSPAAVVEDVLSDHLPAEIARAAAAPLAFRILNQGKRTLEIDVEKDVPSLLATMIEKRIRPQLTENGFARLETVFEQLGPEGLRMWLLRAN